METPNIAYYTQKEGSRKTLSLRELCLRDSFKLESVFYAVRDSENSEELLYNLRKIFYEQIDLEKETDLYIRFKVIDAYGNTNYLKLKNKKSIPTEVTYENN